MQSEHRPITSSADSISNLMEYAQSLTLERDTQRQMIQVLQSNYNALKERTKQLLAMNTDMRAIISRYVSILDDIAKKPHLTREEAAFLQLFGIQVDPLKIHADKPVAAVSQPARQNFKKSIMEIATISPNHEDIGVLRRRVSSKVALNLHAVVEEDSNLAVLLTFPLFASFPQETLNLISDSAFELRRRKGQAIVRKGEEAAEIFFLKEGSVSVMINDEPVTQLHPIAVIGELGVLFQLKRTATVIANSDCLLLVVVKQRMQDVVSSSPSTMSLVSAFTEKRVEWWLREKYLSESGQFGAEFATNIARKHLKNLEIFALAPATCIDTLSMAMKPVVFNQGQNIITIGDDSRAIYFIFSGTVQVIGESNVIHGELSAGSFFGEVGVVLSMKRTASIRAKDACHVFELESENLDRVLLGYPLVKEALEAAVQDRYALFQMKRSGASLRNSEGHIPDQFDLEIGLQSLAKLSIFQGIDDSVLRKLAIKMVRRTWSMHEQIIACGELGTSIFFLAAGTAEVVTEFEETIEIVSGPSAYFGEVAVLQNVPRTATVRCLTVCSTYELRKGDFKEVMAGHPHLASQIKETCDERMRKYLERNANG
ncbi:hypothetical protein HDU78_006092 [Chytriomyces hyalinus]|nr:hypothetical protein HDU78_006092 [Chytriomyces hyalinus]